MITSDVKFIRKYLYSMGEKYSKFRGRGRISFDGDSIVVTGKRIYQPMILRADVDLRCVITCPDIQNKLLVLVCRADLVLPTAICLIEKGKPHSHVVTNQQIRSRCSKKINFFLHRKQF